MNLDEAINCLWLTKAHWPNFEVLAGQQQALQAGAWLDMLSDLDLADVRAALADLDARGDSFPPTPGQVRTTVLGARGQTAPDWDQAYRQVIDGIEIYRRREFDWDAPTERPRQHPVVEDTVRSLGGWGHMAEVHHTATFIRELREMYTFAKERADRKVTTPPAAAALYASVADQPELEAPKRPQQDKPPELDIGLNLAKVSEARDALSRNLAQPPEAT